MKVKLSDLRNNEEPLLGSLVVETEEGFPEYYYYYRTFWEYLDNEIIRTYGDYYYNNTAGKNNVELLALFQKDVKSIMLMYDYKYRGLWDSTKFEYNPIENYSMTEESTIEYIGNENNTDVKSGNVTDVLLKTGSENVSHDYAGTDVTTNVKSGSVSEELSKTGSESTSVVKSGKESTTESFNGSESTQNVVGEISNTNTNSVSADDSSSYSPNEQTTNITNSHTDVATKTFNGRSNTSDTEYTNRTDNSTTTFDERKDSNVTTYDNVRDYTTKSYEGRVDNDTTTYDNRSDSNTTTYNDVTNSSVKSFDGRIDKNTLTRKGNIGVTTSQQMIQSERELVLFSFWNTVFKDIAEELLFYIDDWMSDNIW